VKDMKLLCLSKEICISSWRLEATLDNEVRWRTVWMQLKKLGDGTSLTNEIGPVTDCVMGVFPMTQTNPERLCESGVVATSNCNLMFI
jgi:hypothetical protein